MPTRVEHGGECHDRWSAEAVCNIIGATLLVLDVQFGYGASNAGYDVLPNIFSKVRPIKILLQYCHYFLNPKIPSDPNVVCFPNHLGMLT